LEQHTKTPRWVAARIRPRYCCECGQRIERERWRAWHASGLCDRCAPKIPIGWLGRTVALLTVGATLGFGLGSWSAVRHNVPAPLLKLEPAAVSQTNVRFIPSQELKEKSSQTPDPEAKPQALPGAPSADPATTQKRPQAKTPSFSCGAMTKSGKPCRRKVKGGGRCFQHRGT
jgi:hypothetical protein